MSLINEHLKNEEWEWEQPSIQLTNKELLESFVRQNIEGAAGCDMDHDVAQALAEAIQELLNKGY